MLFMRRLIAPLLLGIVVLGATARVDANDIETTLRTWVTQNLHFEHDRLPLIRTQPVRAFIRSDDPEIVGETRREIANFAEAFGLPIAFVATEINLAVVIGERIADGRKPSRTFLAGLGIPDATIDDIIRVSDWSDGCGLYSGRDDGGRILGSIVAADASLSRKQQRSCVASGVIFGFGMRTAARETIAFPHDHLPFLLIGRALAGCERQMGDRSNTEAARIRDAYLDCMVANLKQKFAE